MDAGTIATLLGGPINACSVRVEEASGALRPIGAPGVFSIEFSHLDFEVYEFEVPHPGGLPTGALVECTRLTSSPVPTIDGGLETNDGGVVLRAGLISTTATFDHLRLDGGVATPPRIAVPEAILVDGLSAPGIVSATPTLLWSAPPSGTPTFYEILIRRVTRTANSFVRSAIAFLYTSRTQLQIPSELLVAGERYVFQVSAVQTGAPEPGRPWLTAVPVSLAATSSTIVIVK
ncbi:MAG: hypothetical protein JNJ54_02035 [Myxococcaceae bacterium]|nr:hypothetical protein [Myxococcaceae bacterium]